MQTVTIKQSDLIRWLRLNAQSFHESNRNVTFTLRVDDLDFNIETLFGVVLSPDPMAEHKLMHVCKDKNVKTS